MKIYKRGLTLTTALAAIVITLTVVAWSGSANQSFNHRKPIEQSNAIIFGKVTGRRAVLMDDKFGIYSEFSIKISEIFKDDLSAFFTDQGITTSRPGGAVRFPSGKVQEYTISLQGYPQQDKVVYSFPQTR